MQQEISELNRYMIDQINQYKIKFEDFKESLYDNENVKKFIEGKTVVKEIFVPGKICNIVVK